MSAIPGGSRPHGIRKMGGRDPHETHRPATPLELFFDLAFVVAFGAAGNEAAHLFAEGHIAAALGGFAFAMFAVCWAWINFSWFASAYDTDDWIFRITTMVQMTGVLILALGMPEMFASIDAAQKDPSVPLDNGVMVLGYVVMRVALVFQWIRAAKQDPARRKTALTYAKFVAVAQIGWVVLIFIDFPILTTFLITVPLVLLEILGPVVAERKGPTPWHAHHIAERYGLLAIIALGEGLIGTVASLTAVVDHQGWTLETAAMGLAGVGITFGLWWLYFILPSGEALHHQRAKGFPWGFGHILIFASIAAMGAGLHVAAYYIDHEAHISATLVVLSVVVPVAVFGLTLAVLYGYLLGWDRFHLLLIVGTLVFLGLSVGLAALGVSVVISLLAIMVAIALGIVADERVGAGHRAAALAQFTTSGSDSARG